MEIKIVETIEDITVLRLPVEGFDKLSLDNKILAYYLWRAGICGDPIVYDQMYAHSLAIRDFFLDILEYHNYIPKEIYDKIELYTKKMVMNKSIHKHDSTKKFIPTFTKKELEAAVEESRKYGFKHSLSNDFERIIFDPEFESMLTQKNPPEGKDIITASHNNFYHNVKLSDIEGFQEKNPLNSTLVMENQKLVEKVWRAGSSTVSPGIYSTYLKLMAHNVAEAIKHAPEEQKKSLEFLKKYFEDGDAKFFDEYNIGWVTSNPEVDAILGFIEQYLDPRGVKGTYGSMTFFKDHHVNHIIHTIADNAQHFEDNSPWSEKYKKEWDNVPVANAIMSIGSSGEQGPFSPAGVNLPNAQWLRHDYGSKNIYVSNVTFSSRNAFAKESWNEFLEKPEDIALMSDSFNVRGPISVTLHEVVGHGSGKMSENLKGDPKDYLKEFYSSLEEARAELCALHHVWDPKLMELGLITDEHEPKSDYLGYVFQCMVMYRRYAGIDEIHESHERATSLIIQYCIDKGSVRFYKKNGKTYPEVIDYQLMRRHIADLLSEIMRIKAEGDYEAGKNLITKYGIHFDKNLRDEIVARSKAIGYPSRFAYVMPHPELVRDQSGKIMDVKLVYYNSIIDQARGWRDIQRNS